MIVTWHCPKCTRLHIKDNPVEYIETAVKMQCSNCKYYCVLLGSDDGKDHMRYNE